jgi:hypothetical protein
MPTPQDNAALGLFRTHDSVMVVLGPTIHEFDGRFAVLHGKTRGWSDQVRP